MTATLELPIVLESGVTSREGCYVCGRCHKVARPSQHEIDVAESMPATRTMLKCAHCHHRTVEWHAPSARLTGRREVIPVSLERGRELFLRIFQDLNVAAHD